jgi:hypothetical protein
VNLIINSLLTEPPSEISCFRDVTLYGKSFVFDDVLIRCAKGTRSFYWKWLKNNGAHDFVSSLILYQEKESGFYISNNGGNLNVDKITCNNLNFIISTINLQRYIK